jgi:hypothetical protein
MWSHLQKVEVEIPRTHKQLIKFDPPKGIKSAKRPRNNKKSRFCRIKSGIVYKTNYLVSLRKEKIDPSENKNLNISIKNEDQDGQIRNARNKKRLAYIC